jgi:phosphoglycolate phosphatase-like HAD superfamily hydrolase
MATAETTNNSETADRVLIREGFVWDAQDAYLFDIDGTLLRSRDRIHFNAFSSSIREVTGLDVSLNGVVLHGGTDTAILREAFELSGVPAEAWEHQVEAILTAMRKTVIGQRGEMDLWTMPGVAETLEHLAKKGALLGLATGNLESIGWTKVEEVGLREWFQFGGFSDRFIVRAEMIADAAAQARELLSSHPSPNRPNDEDLSLGNPITRRMGHPDSSIETREASICVVGDTPRDIEAARANQLPVIAVATGNYSFDELAALEPEVCASSLAALLAQTAAVRR